MKNLYINQLSMFIKTLNYVPIFDFIQGVEAVGGYAENQKIMAIRKVYQRAVVTPILNIETIWKVRFLCNIEELTK